MVTEQPFLMPTKTSDTQISIDAELLEELQQRVKELLSELGSLAPDAIDDLTELTPEVIGALQAEAPDLAAELEKLTREDDEDETAS